MPNYCGITVNLSVPENAKDIEAAQNQLKEFKSKHIKITNLTVHKLETSKEKGEELIKYYPEKLYEFDFNSFIPMPETVQNISYKAYERNAAELLILEPINSILIDSDEFQNHHNQTIRDAFNDYVLHLKEQEPDRVFNTVTVTGLIDYIKNHTNYSKQFNFNRAKQALINFFTYGYVGWYGWSIENWGTKWNASDFEITVDLSDENPNQLQFNFQVAWSLSTPILDKIAELYPLLDIDIYFEEEALFFKGEAHRHVGYDEHLQYEFMSDEDLEAYTKQLNEEFEKAFQESNQSKKE